MHGFSVVHNMFPRTPFQLSAASQETLKSEAMRLDNANGRFALRFTFNIYPNTVPAH